MDSGQYYLTNYSIHTGHPAAVEVPVRRRVCEVTPRQPGGQSVARVSLRSYFSVQCAHVLLQHILTLRAELHAGQFRLGKERFMSLSSRHTLGEIMQKA